MFKTIKKLTSCLLVLCMLLSIAPMGVFAAEPINIDEVIEDLKNPESDLSKNLVAEADKIIDILEAKTGKELPEGEEVIDAIRDYEKTLADLKAAIEEIKDPGSELSQKLVAETDELLDILEAETGATLPSGAEVIEAIRNYEETLPELKAAIDEVIADLEDSESDLSKKLVEEVDKLLAILEEEIGADLPTGAEVIDAIRNYEETLAELEAYIQNVIDEATAKFEENLEAATNAEYATCGDNYYVAIADTYTLDKNDVVEEYVYSINFLKHIGAEDNNSQYYPENIPLAEAVAFVESPEIKADLEKATIVTYQTDAKNIVLPVFDTDTFTPDAWAELLAVDAAKVEEVREAIFAALKGEYAEDVETAKAAAEKIKAEILDKLNVELAEAKAGAAEIDKVVEAVLDIVKAGISDSIDETILNMMTPMAEELVFNVVAYLVNNIRAVETIKAVNTDALIAVVGLHNPVKGLKYDIDGQVFDLGEYVDYFIEATNVYNAAYAMATENVIFVEADETEIAGYSEAIAIDTTNVVGSIGNALMKLLTVLPTGTAVTENGHNYIASQLKAAINLVDHIDANGDEICDKCGENLAQEEEKDPVKPSRPSYGGGGGGLAAGGDKSNTGADDLGQKDEDKTEGTIVPSAPSFFVDVPAGAWYYDVVKEAYDKGLMNGVSATTFAPNQSLTRGMFVTILYRLAGSPAVEAPANFADVPANQYYADAVAWASANGIVNGVSADKFAPNNNITREQMATIIHRYATARGIEAANKAEVTYSDSAMISEFAKAAVEWASGAGVLSGNSDGTFAPLRTATRAEAAAIFVRLLGLVK